MNLVFENNGNIVTTSLLVAEKFGKEHRHVLEAIRELIRTAENSALLNWFEESAYVSAQNKELPMFIMNQDGFTLLVMGFSGKKALGFKMDYIQAFNNMKNSLLGKSQYNVPGSFAEALKLAYQQAEQIELQSNELKKQAPKVEYFDEVLQSDDVSTVNQIALELGLSSRSLNNILKSKGVQYKQGGCWLLYAKYRDKGFVKNKTHTYTGSDGNTHTKSYMAWTESGRLFIHNLFKGNLLSA